jgi:hypothetical protein
MALEWPAVLFIIGPGTVAAAATLIAIWLRRRNYKRTDKSPPE